ncbi:class E sortase [Streptomyces fradiae]|uniref:class E sortase n=1 Tax=Streptomyces fradiae TaxID=1906 RepID=UPI0036BAD20F
MTAARPEHDAAGSGDGHGQEGSPWFRAAGTPAGQEPAPGAAGAPHGWPQQPYPTPADPAYPTPADPGYRAPADAVPADPAYPAPADAAYPAPPAPDDSGYPAYGADGVPQDPYASRTHAPPRQPYDPAGSYPAGSGPYAARQGYAEPYEQPYTAAGAPVGARPADVSATRSADASATAVLPTIEPGPGPATPGPDPAGPDPAAADAGPGRLPEDDPQAAPVPSRHAGAPPTGGRAERRRAAKGRGGRRKGPASPTASAGPAGLASAGPATAASPTGAPLSRVEARRAARAAKDGFGVIASRVMGEVFITFGVVMLLFVAYQLWWTNVQAGMEVDKAKNRIAEDWAKGGTDRTPGVFEAGEGFAIIHIPKLDVVVPVAEGIDKEKVLDKGMAGHYAEGALKTAMPSDKQGNFAVAGHRNTHGEPFRYINRLKPGDPIVVETREAYYTYEMASILPQTPPSNVSVLKPIPDGSGFTEPGRYLTLTTCTPEFTSTYRMIVWGKMVEERPRSKGVPDALAG